jgi:prolipoprotein diacylglyceryltransferase
MNHGVYAGLAAVIGLTGAAWLSGAPGWTIAVCTTSIVGAGLWAQLVEGSSMLLRPFGYYGSLLGAIVGALLVASLGGPAMAILAALAIVAPWVQAIGRLRCLVQGCCHGRPTRTAAGLRIHNPRSRVCRLAELVDVPIHATQLYSILGNIVLGVLLARLWTLRAPLSLVAGLYLVLGSLLRFVEEGYRGEPQTPALAGLPIYQWLSVLGAVAGAVVMALPAAPAIVPAAPPGPWVVTAAIAFGTVCWFAMGVDFPESNRRFARLSD